MYGIDWAEYQMLTMFLQWKQRFKESGWSTDFAYDRFGPKSNIQERRNPKISALKLISSQEEDLCRENIATFIQP